MEVTWWVGDHQGGREEEGKKCDVMYRRRKRNERM
jgi:hypothetical protein